MKKMTIEECECLNISTIIYHLKYDRPSSRRSITDELKSLSEKSLSNEFCGMPDFCLRFTTTKCHLGGVRYWFLCPSCSKRVGKLYAPLSADEFKCRYCHNLTYKSTQNHNQRVDSLSRQLNYTYKKMGKEALDQTIRMMGWTRRSRKFLNKVCDKLTTRYPSPFLARKHKERECYEKYIKLLFEVQDDDFEDFGEIYKEFSASLMSLFKGKFNATAIL